VLRPVCSSYPPLHQRHPRRLRLPPLQGLRLWYAVTPRQLSAPVPARAPKDRRCIASGDDKARCKCCCVSVVCAASDVQSRASTGTHDVPAGGMMSRNCAPAGGLPEPTATRGLGLFAAASGKTLSVSATVDRARLSSLTSRCGRRHVRYTALRRCHPPPRRCCPAQCRDCHNDHDFRCQCCSQTLGSLHQLAQLMDVRSPSPSRSPEALLRVLITAIGGVRASSDSPEWPPCPGQR
jgi:hypothetical protein